ncbi:MAG: ribosome small subunit-dependent GTPase A [Steroidobacteraceae bacterium]
MAWLTSRGIRIILAAQVPATFDAQVIAAFGRSLIVRGSDGVSQRARPPGRTRGRSLDIVCGDSVTCRRDAPTGEVHVTALLPRATVLYRSTGRGGAESVAANLDLLVVVLAPLPQPDFFIADRYLCAAACAGLQAQIVLNKQDLQTDPDIDVELAAYVQLDYPVLRCETRSPNGSAALAASLHGRTATLVGQSGVGKSSLIATLAIDADEIVTAQLARDDEGRHTTTAARLYDCRGGGSLIDSPGVRDYAPAIDHLDPRSLGFLEVEALAPGCKFQDCRHMSEPRCAVRAAVDAGTMHARRYESYRRLRRLYEELGAVRGPR